MFYDDATGTYYDTAHTQSYSSYLSSQYLNQGLPKKELLPRPLWEVMRREPCACCAVPATTSTVDRLNPLIASHINNAQPLCHICNTNKNRKAACDCGRLFIRVLPGFVLTTL